MSSRGQILYTVISVNMTVGALFSLSLSRFLLTTAFRQQHRRCLDWIAVVVIVVVTVQRNLAREGDEKKEVEV
jgi:hypothetical protein